MPLPKTQNVGTMMHFLKKEKPGMPHKQRVAIALSQARREGKPSAMSREIKNRAKKQKK